MAERKKLPRLVDAVEPPPFPGKRIAINLILGDEVIVTDFYFYPPVSTKRNGSLAIEVMRNGRREWFITRSQRIREFFEKVPKNRLPCRAVFDTVPDQGGTWDYTVQ